MSNVGVFNKRPISILRYNAENMRKNGAPQEVIAKYLADNGSNFQQIMSVRMPTKEILDRALASEQDGSFAEKAAKARQITDESQARKDEYEKSIENKENWLGRVRAFGNGLTFGLEDEIENAMGGAPREQIRQEQKQWAQEHPIANVGYNVAGAMFNPVKLPIGKGVTLAGKMGRGAAQSGLYGALYGFGSGEGGLAERTKNAAKEGTAGAVVGAAVPLVTEGVKKVGGALVEGVGKASGAGGETLKRGYDAGKRGSQTYLDAMRKKSSVYDVVDDVDNAVRQMERERGAAFNAALPKDRSFMIPQDRVVEALNNAKNEISGVTAGVDDTAAKALAKAQKLMNNVNKNGGLTFNNALDMKKGLDSIVEPLKSSGEKNAVRILTPIQSALKQTMTESVPEYAAANKEFSKASKLINAIKDAFQSKNPTTELRSLQSITRDSVAAAQGGKLELGNILDNVSNKRILDAVAGNQVQQVLPRDFLRGAFGVGSIAGSSLLGSSALAPTAAITIPAMSPRLSGEAAYWLGRGVGSAGNVLNKVDKFIPSVIPRPNNADAAAVQLYEALKNTK